RFSSSSSSRRSSRAWLRASNAISRASSTSASIGVEEDAAELTSAMIASRAAVRSTKYREMQHFVRLHPPHIVAIEQPVQLLAGQCHNRLFASPWPVKLLSL